MLQPDTIIRAILQQDDGVFCEEIALGDGYWVELKIGGGVDATEWKWLLGEQTFEPELVG